MEYIYLLRQALVYLIVVFWIYELAISLCALIKFKEKPLLKKEKPQIYGNNTSTQ